MCQGTLKIARKTAVGTASNVWVHCQASKIQIPGMSQVALPELDGGLEPIVFAGRDSATGKSHSLPDRIDSLCERAINWAK